ncbi:MAG TPA: YbhB/YbcL family Raf kinase inhibitor-like protein [Candidatus Limnocylindrales bacterium]|nr:YbhB/YbcL family Raf kinase inhibitor-like protein [Candidatus Limnocylindrales bacterium]
MKGLKVIAAVAALAAFGAADATAQRGGFQLAQMFMETDAFPDGGIVPVRYTGAVWNIPASAGGIPEGGLPDGAVQTERGYRGPGAPPGPRCHHYVWELFALNGTLELPPTASRDEILAAMEGMVVAKAAYVGRFRREG